MPAPIAAEDRFAVADLLARYCWFIDEGQATEWAALFTDDGALEGALAEPVRGTAALADFAATLYRTNKGKSRHQFGNLWLEPGPDSNTLIARFYNQISTWDGAETRLKGMALSTATLRRDGAGEAWRMAVNVLDVRR